MPITQGYEQFRGKKMGIINGQMKRSIIIQLVTNDHDNEHDAKPRNNALPRMQVAMRDK